MTDALETVAFLQGGQQYQYLDDVNERSPYFILRSDGSLSRQTGMGGSSNVARVKDAASDIKNIFGGMFGGGMGQVTSTGGFAEDPHAGSGNGEALSGPAIAAVKEYLNKMYNLGNVQDGEAWSWLERASRIDDATASYEDFNERLIQDVVQNEGGGDPAATEAVLKRVMGAENFQAMADSQNSVVNGGPGTEAEKEAGAGIQGIIRAAMAKQQGDLGIPSEAGAAGAGGNYVIKSGDTLSAIAAAHGTTVEALAQANGIADPNTISAGASLTIPGAGGGADAGAGAGAGGGAGTAGAAAGVSPAAGGGIAGDVPGVAPGSSTAGAGGGRTQVPQQSGVGPDGSTVTPDLLQQWLEDPDVGFFAVFNAMVNSYRDAGAASVFVNFVASQFSAFRGQYMGELGEQAMNGQIPSGTFQEFVSRKSGGMIPPGAGGVSSMAPKAPTTATGARTSAPRTGTEYVPEVQPGPGPLPAGSPAQSPTLGETAGLAPISPELQALVLGV